jgi:hypothetical protein
VREEANRHNIAQEILADSTITYWCTSWMTIDEKGQIIDGATKAGDDLKRRRGDRMLRL